MVVPERQFDFWVGEWEVFDPAGRHVGQSRIELTTGGRVILENWSGDGGGAGTSINFFDARSGHWHQVWVDSQGGVLRFEGEFVDGALRYSGETPLADGTRQMERLTFTPVDGGRVHQFWEQSQDRGVSWTVAFDGTYVPRAQAADPSSRSPAVI
jgi:hypothetical protein